MRLISDRGEMPTRTCYDRRCKTKSLNQINDTKTSTPSQRAPPLFNGEKRAPHSTLTAGHKHASTETHLIGLRNQK